AALEAVNSFEDAQPCFLDDLFGNSAARHVHPGNPQHPCAIHAHQCRERSLVTSAQAVDQLRVLTREQVLHRATVTLWQRRRDARLPGVHSAQFAARPAIAGGRPAQEPTGSSAPSATRHPQMRPPSVSIAYRNSPPPVSPWSRRPGTPSKVTAATASSSTSSPAPETL